MSIPLSSMKLCQNSLNVGTCLWHVYPNRWFSGLTSQSDVPTSLNSRNLTHPHICKRQETGRLRHLGDVIWVKITITYITVYLPLDCTTKSQSSEKIIVSDVILFGKVFFSEDRQEIIPGSNRYKYIA